MAKLESIQRIYFIGIGGIGMSALARYFVSRGVRVSGYDRTETPLTKALVAEGIPVHYTEDITAIPLDVDVVVYTPAVPAVHAGLVYYREKGFEVVKRSDVLQWITESSFNVCVGGTHGKTTISTMTAHILTHTGYGCNAFLGGISANYNTNFWSSERHVAVVEADEYDRSFLKLVPDVAVITAMDADHLDIYGTAEEVENAFVQFSQRVKPGGCLVSKYGLSRSSELQAAHHFTYSFDQTGADVYAADVKVMDGSYHYNVIANNWQLNNVVLHMGGLHNIENSVAAITVAKYLGIDDEKIKAAVASFKGVKRRFEYLVREEGKIMIDDYAHHPQELKALITGVRSLYGNAACTVVFQPHLFSRTKDLAEEFAASLDLADEVILLPVYPARELPMEGVTSELIARYMKHSNVKLLSKEEMLQYVGQQRPSLLVMSGAGDIDALLEPVKEILTGA
ncbi:UDP-N-acetylmuramate--L-alanine ligase [Filimonas lacunae]|uniref:UDP-N-acetylmuramate--L-alanine ligase n=1 Tax=Filimonas lacunae TaxID=477680 RepID=A0A173MRP7_9BACT|nr:UDP-N-acetylmuramate--L-alanine ligase [Filimonas lacunae]BAV10355.1 UDP-N-acetylmuramate-alanine ligase [Filimonas lacunae]SIT16743.1 UDP-N-acetylmuramate--L-alanine ligase [Filimonas lacunae]